MPMTEIFRIGQDAEVRSIGGNNTSLCELSLAYNYRGKAGEKRPTQWIQGKLWGKRADSLADYLKKGEQVSATLEGVHIEEFTKKDGTASFKLTGEIIAIELVSSGQRATAPTPKPATRPVPRPAPVSDFGDDDGDVPF